MPEEVSLSSAQEESDLPQQHRRDIPVENVALDRDDLFELLSLVRTKTEDAQVLQVEWEDLSKFRDKKHLEEEVKKFFRVGSIITDSKNNTISIYDIGKLEPNSIPDEILTIYISNSILFKDIASGRAPRNSVDIFLDFSRPSMAIDFLNMPSNPTPNRNVVNVYGYNEDWVIATHQKLREFFDRKKKGSGFLHRSGIYDAFLYLIFLPIIFWIAYSFESSFADSFKDISVVLLVAIYVYAFIISVGAARVIFQYVRWLFPLVEYVPKSRLGPAVHRGILLTVLSAIGLAFLYDVIRSIFS